MEAEKLKAVKINGHRGKWYSIDSKQLNFQGKNKTFHVMEHEEFGEDADWIMIDELENVILENLNGFLGYVWNELYELLDELIVSSQ